jgi:hypothetical protein
MQREAKKEANISNEFYTNQKINIGYFVSFLSIPKIFG